MTELFCPLLKRECLRLGCAFYVADEHCCAIKLLADALDIIASHHEG